MKEISIVFMGTPEFAVASLSHIYDSGIKVKAVVTVADKPAGRGLKLRYSPVKEFALQHNLPVLQPVNLKDEEFLKQLKSCNANLFVVVAFRKLPEEVWAMPELGTFNLHASLLPQYRGAAPINHVIINGEKTTGVTTFFLNSGIDMGKMIMSDKLEIGLNETAGELHDRLKEMGAKLTLKTIKSISSGEIILTDQPMDNNDLKSAPKIHRDFCKINWNRPAIEIHNHIRGLSPYPGAFSFFKTESENREMKVLKSSLTGLPCKSKPGHISIVQNKRMHVCCSDEMIEILLVQPSGKKIMTSEEFARGVRAEMLIFS